MPIPTMLLLFGGLVAGLIHVLSGPDHLAAIAPLAARYPRRAWLHGLRWGFGHSAGVLLVGILALILRDRLPIDGISDWSERLLGVLLIGIGCWALRKAVQIHEHEHSHGGDTHRHIHMHGQRIAGDHHHSVGHHHSHAALGIGTLHGLAGSSHFLAIIPALALASNIDATSYLFAYGTGTIVAMMLFAHLIGSAAGHFAQGARAYRRLMLGCAGMAVLVGGLWVTGFSF